MRLTVRVPATVANLGPGFDAFGLALALHNDITVDTDAEPSVTIEGEGADELPPDETNLVVSAMRSTAEALDRRLPTLGVHCVNRIPVATGLGSSAAAIVGAVILAARVLDGIEPSESLLAIAAKLEGHADNVAAAIHGGVTIAYEDRRTWRSEHLVPSPGLRPVLLIPERDRLRTEDARRVLPGTVSRADATFNAGRAALMVLALRERPELLAVAMQDRLHQEARLGLAQASRGLFDRLREASVPVCVAGSGPTLLAFETEEAAVPDPGDGWRALRLDVDLDGARVLEETEQGE